MVHGGLGLYHARAHDSLCEKEVSEETGCKKQHPSELRLTYLATSKSCLNNFWNRDCGRRFHAIVSVMAVKIQLSSPKGVLLST